MHRLEIGFNRATALIGPGTRGGGLDQEGEKDNSIHPQEMPIFPRACNGKRLEIDPLLIHRSHDNHDKVTPLNHTDCVMGPLAQ
jgi:hypothetical protein